MSDLPQLRNITVDEAILLGARDIPTFGQIWFPKAFRQASPPMHYEMSAALQNREKRLVGLKVFRDGAKTTLARAYAMQRIAYCISRLILLVNINATKAEQSLRWIKRQVEYNTPFAQAYKLRKGDKWSDSWITVINSQGETVNVIAMGISGGLRGFNLDDHRPDFILCDDICDAENTATEDQRAKTNEALFAQLVRSLAPASEAPLAQLVLIQTPINDFDAISMAERDPSWRVVSFSCFTPDGQSSWPARRTTDDLLKEKAGYIGRNMLAMWLAEMEVTIVSSELKAFIAGWLKTWQVYPEDGQTLIVCDPASSEKDSADFFAIAVLKVYRSKFYLLAYHLERGLMPDAACDKIFEYHRTYGARDVVVETVAYQRILKWYLEGQIRAKRTYLNVHSYDDKRRKEDRIVQAITMVAPYGNLLIGENHQEFIEVFTLFGPGYKGKVDLLDAVSIGISHIFSRGGSSVDIEGDYQRLREEEETLPDINEAFQGAP